MIDTKASRALFPLLALGVVALPACNGIGPFNAVDGSGVPETTTIETADFDKIDVTGVFEVTLTIQDGPPSVVVTVDDNLVDDLDVAVRDDRLRVGFESGSYDVDVQPTATVTVASLSDIDVSGASQLTVTELTGEELTIDVSGASDLVASGSIAKVSIDASGASDVDLLDLVITTADVDISGASNVELGHADRVNGELSGASNLTAPADASGSIETSGASNIERE